MNLKKILTIFMFLLLISGCAVHKNSGNSNNQETEDNSTPTFYVSTVGDDSNSGTKDSPWKTIQHALETLSPGEKAIIRSGIYNEKLYMDRSGSEGKMIQIMGESATETVLEGNGLSRDLIFIEGADYIEISNLLIRNAERAGIRLSYSNHIELSDLTIKDCGKWGVFTDFSNYTTVENCDISGSEDEHGIYLSNSSDNGTIRGNRVYNNVASGIQINADPSMGGDGISSNCLIENNIVYGNGKWGGAAINLASVRDSTIQNNIIYNNYAGGIAGWDDGQGYEWGSKNLLIIHNTIIFESGEGRWAISLKNGSSNAKVFNNILCGGRRGGFEFNTGSLSGIEINNNIYYRFGSNYMVSDEDDIDYTLSQWQGRGYDKNSFFAEPSTIFVDFSGLNFHLKSTSAALDKGVDKNLKYDFEGDSRPQGGGPDIGADESGNQSFFIL